MANENFEIGKLYQHYEHQLSPRFCEIKDGKVTQKSYTNLHGIYIKANKPIMIIKSYNLTPEKLYGIGKTSLMAPACAAATRIEMEKSFPDGDEPVDWQTAKQIWKNSATIFGYKCLFENKFIWLSEIDAKYFKKCK